MPLPVCLAWQVPCRPRVRLLPQVPQSRVLSPFRLQFLRLRLRLRLRLPLPPLQSLLWHRFLLLSQSVEQQVLLFPLS